MRIRRALPALALAAGLSVPAFAQNPASAADGSFVNDAAVGGMTEVELSRLALQKSSDPQIKKFAQQMVTDHTKAGHELEAAAREEGITPPAQLDATHKDLVDKFRAMSGPSFDQAYKRQMLEDHDQTVSKFQKEATESGSPLQKFAAATLPTLQSHLKMAEQLNGGASAH
jgi:putative membrane protein